MMVEGNFRFFPVGQGMFYGGTISVFNDSVNFVYDCGALNNDNDSVLNRAIETSRDFFLNKLDMLFVSHFHEDHVNGIPKLLKQMNQSKQRVKYVVLPYFSPDKLLVLQARIASWLSKVKDHDNDYRVELERLAFNPYAYFAQHEGVGRIIVVDGGEFDSDGDGGPEGSKEPKKPSKNETSDKASKWDDESLEKKLFDKFDVSFASDGALKDKLLGDIAKCQSAWKQNTGNVQNPLDAAKGLLYMQFLDIWYWKAVVPPVPSQKIDVFKQALKSAQIIDQDEQPDWERFQESCKPNTPENEAIRKAYEIIRPKDKLNLTSLVLAHGPFCNNCGSSRGARKTGLVTVLFGDTSLYNKEIYTSLTAKLSQELKNAKFLSVPHHGSRYNWGSDILSFPRQCSCWVVSSAIKSRFHHPHGTVVYDFYCLPESLKYLPLLYWCNEKCSVDVMIKGDTSSRSWQIRPECNFSIEKRRNYILPHIISCGRECFCVCE